MFAFCVAQVNYTVHSYPVVELISILMKIPITGSYCCRIILIWDLNSYFLNRKLKQRKMGVCGDQISACWPSICISVL